MARAVVSERVGGGGLSLAAPAPGVFVVEAAARAARGDAAPMIAAVAAAALLLARKRPSPRRAGSAIVPWAMPERGERLLFFFWVVF